MVQSYICLEGCIIMQAKGLSIYNKGTCSLWVGRTSVAAAELRCVHDGGLRS